MKLLLIFLLLVLIFRLSALDFDTAGLKIGYNSSRFTGDDIYGKGVSNIPGFVLGEFISYDFNRNFFLDPEILISTKGSCVNTIGDIDQHNVFVYLELPFICKYKLHNSSSLTPLISCGSAFAVKTLAINDTGVLDNIRGYDLSLLAALGIEYRFASLELRYQLGIINIDKSIGGSGIRNRSLSFQIGIKLLRENI